MDAQLCMLDKLCTYEAAAKAGVPTPMFWPVGDLADLDALRLDLVYPLVVKPRQSQAFSTTFGRKFFRADSFEAVQAGVAAASAAGHEVLLMELIPGGDDRLCS